MARGAAERGACERHGKRGHHSTRWRSTACAAGENGQGENVRGRGGKPYPVCGAVDGRPATLRSWTTTLRKHALPKLGKKAVDAITVRDAKRLLKPLWTATPAAGREVRTRCAAVISHAVAQGWREGNPFADVAAAMPRQATRRVGHAAMPRQNLQHICGNAVAYAHFCSVRVQCVFSACSVRLCKALVCTHLQHRPRTAATIHNGHYAQRSSFRLA